MLLGVKIKQPDERLDYDFLYSEWIGTSGDELDSVVVEIVGTGSLSATPALTLPNIQKVWVEGGDDGEEYTIEVTATTLAGRIKQDELKIIIQEF